MDASALVVGCVIGAGIFRLSDSVARAAGSPFVFFLAWVVAGVLSMAGALTYAELATRFPRTGGDYVFLTEGYGRAWGFLFGWTKLFVQRTGTIAIIAVVFAEHALRAVGGPPGAVRATASAAILALTAANIVGLRYGAGVQRFFTALKLAALALIIVVGAIAGKGSFQNFTPFWPDVWTPRLLSQTGLAMIFALWTYGGWTESAYVAGEVRDPARNLPRSIIGGLGLVTLFYLLVNGIYLYYLPLPVLRETDLVAAGAMDRVWVGRGGQVVAMMVMASTFGALNGYILTGGRILQALGGDHALFRRLGAISPSTGTPAGALVVTGALALALVWTGTLDTLVTYTEIVIYLFFAATGATVFLFRRRHGAPDGHRAWGYPVTPAIFILLSLAFAVNAILEAPTESLIGIGVAALGWPLYRFSEALSRRSDPSRNPRT
jgi:amino acid transporter